MTTPLADHHLWTIDDTAAYLRISPETLRGWIKDRRAPPYRKLGSSRQAKLRFEPDAVIRWVSGLPTNPQARGRRGRPRKNGR
ncbi:helix-turn-helix domain-containing protein [Paramagnetospirillum caucaseum]|uniref:helix-turn-helix domain-containing protein n=1 Tax=Paramagnetospirillum caucaseum TaxID=1244869 RepID=UPI0009DB003F